MTLRHSPRWLWRRFIATPARNKQAEELYKQLAAKPTSTVGKVTAQIELAATYKSDNQPLEAKRIYETIQKGKSRQ